MQFPTGGIVRERRVRMIWCNSKTDRIVWMKEDESAFLTPKRQVCSFGRFFSQKTMKKREFLMKNDRIRSMTTAAMLTALAVAAVWICRIPIVLFLKYEPKNVILTIGGFLFGPMMALVVTVASALIEMITVSDTAGWGLLMNILASGSFAVLASLAYRKKRTLTGAVIGLIGGTILSTAMMLLWNWLVTPLYMGIERADVIKLLVPYFLPFNALKGSLNSALTLLLYKPAVTALRHSGLLRTTANTHAPQAKTTVLVSACAAALLACSVIAFIVLHG